MCVCVTGEVVAGVCHKGAFYCNLEFLTDFDGRNGRNEKRRRREFQTACEQTAGAMRLDVQDIERRMGTRGKYRVSKMGQTLPIPKMREHKTPEIRASRPCFTPTRSGLSVRCIRHNSGNVLVE